MNKKIGYLIVFISFFIIASFNVSLILAQPAKWDVVHISAYGTGVDETDTTFSFIVATPPAGSDIENVIYVEHTDFNENYTTILTPGQNVIVSHSQVDDPLLRSIEPASEPDHFIILFDGEARYVRIDSADIPEFQTFMIIPLFIAATLLTLIYKRKRTK